MRGSLASKQERFIFIPLAKYYVAMKSFLIAASATSQMHLISRYTKACFTKKENLSRVYTLVFHYMEDFIDF